MKKKWQYQSHDVQDQNKYDTQQRGSKTLFTQ